jgi:hypothetical protein
MKSMNQWQIRRMLHDVTSRSCHFVFPYQKATSLADCSHESAGCFVWDGCRDKDGYGVMEWKAFRGGRQWRIHRLSYFLFVGEVNSESMICHTCDNRACWNPDHLYKGTAKTNSKDMDDRGRRITARGEGCGASKLKTKDVLKIRKIYSPKPFGNNCHQLAKRYGVCFQSIWNIVTGKTWRHI